MNRSPIPVRIFRDREDSRFWLARVDLDGGHLTQGRTIAEARSMARDLAALVLEVDDNLLVLECHVDLGGDLDADVAEARRAREDLERIQHRSARTLRAAARRLVGEAHLTQRDAADLLGVSHQRVAQVLREPDEKEAIQGPKALGRGSPG